jgi:uncharacterized protein YndB with AHSA1/START domain
MTETVLFHSSFTIERHYGASPARVFDCFAKEEKLRRWLVEGEGWTVDRFTHDFTVGGRDHSAFRWQNGPLITNDGVYHEIVDNERIITSYSMALDGRIFSVSLLTQTFEARDGGTLLTMTEQGTYFNDANAAKGREEGFLGLLDSLGAEVARGE